MKKETAEKIFTAFSLKNPSPKTELAYTNHYTLLVAIILSAQSTDVGVNKATPTLFKIADTPEKMLKLGELGIKKYIKTIGLFNSKAKNIIKMSETLVSKHKSQVPQEFSKLKELAGVGRKTANVWLNCALGHETIAVDTHVFRVSNRIGLVKAKKPEQTEEQLLKIVPKKYMKDAHHWLILHGRYVCKARRPDCKKCIIFDFCECKEKFI